MKNIAKLTLVLILSVLAAGCKSKPATVDTTGNIRDIFAGVADVFMLMDDGTLWGAGYNRSGQLGLGQITPGEIILGDALGDPLIALINDDTGAPISGVRFVAAGENHTVILKEDGSLWGAGDSTHGELGLDGEKLLFFTQLKAENTPLSGVKTLAAGNNSTFYISGDGSLWTAGYNYYGELGLGNRDTQASFKKVESAGQNVKTLAAGIRHTVLLKEDGTLWTAGYNFNGQLGLGVNTQGDTEDRNSFTQVRDAGSGITAVAAGNYHTVILKNDGSVWAAGSNFWGQIGFPDSSDRQTFTRVTDENGNTLSNVKEIAARGDITVLLKADGSLLLAGNYDESDAENEPEEDSSRANRKSTFVPLVAEQGTKLGTVKKIVLGTNSVYVVDSDNHLWAAGSNRYGQLHLGYDTEASAVLKLINP